MNNALSTSSADTQEIGDVVLEQTEESALKTAAESRAKVADVEDLQRKAFLKLLNVKGSDGVAEGGQDMSIPEDLNVKVEKGIKQRHVNRMKNIAAASDAYMLPDEGTVVGVQHDDTRKIGIAGRGLKDNRVAKHEAKHREQEVGDAVAEIPETGDALVDGENGTIDRLTFRERGAIDAEGGLSNHTPEYHGYVQRSEAVARYLNSAGINGDELVKEAGKTNEGFQRLQGAIVMATTRKRLEEAGVTSAALVV